VLDTREVYQNPWIRVREDQVLRPDGSPGIYGVVECEPAVAVVALTSASEVYLVGQYRYTTQTYSWEVVSGYANPGEDTLDAAKRELREEAGLAAAAWTSLGTCEVSNSVTDQFAFIYLAQGLTPMPASPDATEQLTVRLATLREALAMAQSGAISQAVSATAVFRAWHQLNPVEA
jgi:8-oxo-dGTP pyrophosphatase MutT (NUDIX family)